MIVRVLRAKVRAGRVSAFNALFRRQVTLLREQPGLAYVKLARRLHRDGSQDAVLFEEWQDAASLYAWVGPNLAEPRLIPGARELIDEVSVAHYEALEDDLADDLNEGADLDEVNGVNGADGSAMDSRTSPALATEPLPSEVPAGDPPRQAAG